MNFEGNLSAKGLSIDKAAADVVQLLAESKKKISCAESCTGGLVSAAITAVPGSSEVFDVGICTYANSAKMKYLGVKQETLDSFGAVSRETALEMAEGIRLAANSDIGVSVTGIAGPAGGTQEKPVGTVYVGISTEEKCEAALVFTDGDGIPQDGLREYIRKNTVLTLLMMLKREL